MLSKNKNKHTSAAVRSSPSPRELTPRATSSHACLFSSLMAVFYQMHRRDVQAIRLLVYEQPTKPLNDVFLRTT